MGAGQERFRTITTSYFRGAQGILLVYDVADRSTFNSIRNWIAQIQQHADINVNKILVGNKCDAESRKVSTEEGEKLARSTASSFLRRAPRPTLTSTRRLRRSRARSKRGCSRTGFRRIGPRAKSSRRRAINRGNRAAAKRDRRAVVLRPKLSEPCSGGLV